MYACTYFRWSRDQNKQLQSFFWQSGLVTKSCGPLELRLGGDMANQFSLWLVQCYIHLPWRQMVGHMTVVTCYLGFLALSWYLPDRLFFVIVRNRRNGLNRISSRFFFYLFWPLLWNHWMIWLVIGRFSLSEGQNLSTNEPINARFLTTKVRWVNFLLIFI